MKVLCVASILFVVLILNFDHATASHLQKREAEAEAEASPEANPEPMPGATSKVHEYCQKKMSGASSPNEFCDYVTESVIKRLKKACDKSVDKICKVAFGYKDKCKDWLRKHVCHDKSDENAPAAS